MKNKIGKLYGFVLALVFCAGLSVFSLSASASGSYTLAVGEEKTLYSNIPSRYALRAVNWTSSNYQAVEITQHTDSYCRIRVNQYFSSPVIIYCDYYYVDSFGGASYMREGFTDFTIYISGSGGGSGSTGSMTASPSSVSLDLATQGSAMVQLEFDTGGVRSYNLGFRSDSECCYADYWGSGISAPGHCKVGIYARKPGTGTVTCNLLMSGSVRASVKIKVNVTCSHKYDDGVVSVEPAPGKAGTKVYTCQIENCGHQYETSIPALSDSKKNESSKKEQKTGNKKQETENKKKKTGDKKQKTGNKKQKTGNKKQETRKTDAKLNKKSAVLYPGQKLSLSLKNAKSGKQNWSSSDPKVATVNAKGMVTAKKPGAVNIRVKTGGKTYTCRVTVKKVFTVSSSKLSVAKGKKETVTVTCGKKLELKYKIKNKKTVSCKWKKGKGTTYTLTIQGKKKGKTTVTLTNSFNQEKIKLNVNVE